MKKFATLKKFIPYFYALLFILISGIIFYSWRYQKIQLLLKQQLTLQQQLQQSIKSVLNKPQSNKKLTAQQLFSLLQRFQNKLQLKLDTAAFPQFTLTANGDSQTITQLLEQLLPQLTIYTKLQIIHQTTQLQLILQGKLASIMKKPFHLPLIPALQTSPPLPDLLQWEVRDLHYSGYLQLPEQIIALLRDPYGHYYQTKTQDPIGNHGDDHIIKITTQYLLTAQGKKLERD